MNNFRHYTLSFLLVSGLFNISLPALSEESLAESLILPSASMSDTDLLGILNTEKSLLLTRQADLQKRFNDLESEEGIFWGKDAYGRDTSWVTLWGFALPGITQLYHVFNNDAPLWLRLTSAGQLVSLGVVGYGSSGWVSDYIATRSPYDYSRRAVNLPALDQASAGYIYGGLAAYGALAIIPSAVVSTHDTIARKINDEQFAIVKQELTQVNATLDEKETMISPLTHAEKQNYVDAIALAEQMSPEEALSRGWDFDRVRHWKKALFTSAYQRYEETYPDLEINEKLAETQTLLSHPYLFTAPDVEKTLKLKLPVLKEQAVNADIQQQAREIREKQAQERKSVYEKAYQLAIQQEFSGAVSVLGEYDWKPEHPEYAKVQEKIKVWSMAWLTQKYKDAFETSAGGDVETGLGMLLTLVDIWPPEHPDYKRAQQKIKDWTFILNKQYQFKKKNGFLTTGQIKLLKDKGYPIIMSTDLPSGNEWYSMVRTHESYNQYSIFEYDKITGKSYTIIGGHLCGSLSLPMYRSVTGKAQGFITNPALGKIGIISIGYADAYITTNLSKSKDNCYTVVTPGNLESWMTGNGEDEPNNTKRLTKQEFIQLVKSLRYLP